jgi:capsular exopolysaccharide synthesis family protein
VKRRLATVQALLTTDDVLGSAAARFRRATVHTLKDKVSASVTPDANIVDVVATDSHPSGAAAIANAVARAFLAKQRTTELRQLARARGNLLQAMARLRGQPGSEVELRAIRERLSELSVSQASAGSEFQLAQAAERPSSPHSPRPIRNTVFALLASSFLAVLVALGREQFAPRLTARELSRRLALPVLAEIPFVRRRFGRKRFVPSALEEEAYRTLQAQLRMIMRPPERRIVLVTSAVPREGKTEVTASLGRVLAESGEKTLLVSADMRWPTLHERFALARGPGLADVLADAWGSGGESAARTAIGTRTKRIAGIESEDGNLEVLVSGRTADNPARLLGSSALDAFFDELRDSDYSYVLLDAPPLLGIADSHLLARHVDGVLVVCRPSGLTPEDVGELGTALDQLGVDTLGLVVVGAGRVSPYYSRVAGRRRV